ncbi:MAG: CtsR family transcriptional regulator [Peptoniphilaceae bacterium]|uniref:CtsR family transcriptional regulator n=1 Tax=Parvimonas sp. TaxID=1944660 RepID=UPI0025D44F37|nr:CtsR family transcriptional regulator [Parvimonas sp.]MCI5997218.1 CtsR family transcriptional regulator [Parvimonas sp.]MDD7764481.1 CtsR family transcriptional regulator [Peptoniphilaceae bacterium]MDY3051291.1 CtsR family transcriptional regulator [Parvimonas sp.]
MAGISDIIEIFLKEMLEKSENGVVEIGRNELANRFSCAPSQINYVLTTRFSSTNGYYVESRRGGSGYIKITELDLEDDFINSIIEYLDNNSITFNESVRIVDRMFELKYLNKKERLIILHAISDNSVLISDVVARDMLRANILKNILISFRREYE